MSRALTALALACHLVSCSEDGGTTWAQTIPEGTYAVSGPVCASSDKRPRYPAQNFQAALYDFDDLTARRITVGPGASFTEIYTDPDCTLTVARLIYRNAQGELTTRAGKTHVFAPAGCTLGVRFRDYVYPIGKSYSPVFEDRDGRDPSLAWYLFETSADRKTFTFVTDTVEPVATAWGPYGCEPADQLRKTLIRM